jgi:hypothetical protein
MIDHIKVYFANGAAVIFAWTVNEVNAILTTISLLSAIIYTWLKILQRRKK